MIIDGNTYYKIANGLVANDGITLPSEYQRVEYIESSGTQYIDTGVTIGNTINTIIDYNYTSIDSNERYLYGYDSPYVFGMMKGTGRFFSNGGSTFNIDTERHIAELGLVVKIDGVTKATRVSVPTTTENYFIFSGNPNKYFILARVYNLQIFDNNNLVRYFIPCYRKSDSVIGMYDIVNGVFYTNQGSGTFLKGKDVTIYNIKAVPYDAEIEYLESDGNQYIDTGITCTTPTKYILRGAKVGNRASNKSGFFGSNAWLYSLIFYTSDNNLRWCNYSNRYDFNNLVSGTFYDIECNKNGSMYVNGNETSLNSDTNFGGDNIKIFVGAYYAASSVKISKFKIYNGETLLLDLIPVRKGNVGYMYDKVSGKLFGNSGTGNFILGPDKEETPYISGHVTDGSSTFSFLVNENVTITTNVDSKGDFKWYADRKITSLKQAFNEKRNISFVKLCNLKDFTNMTQMFRGGSADTNLTKIVFKNCDFSNVTNLTNAFSNRRGLISIEGLDRTTSLNTSLNCTFQYCESLVFDSDFNWDKFINSGITNFTGTFMSCKGHSGTIDLSNSSSPTAFPSCFGNCYAKTIIFPQSIPSNCNVDGIFTGAFYVENIIAYSISNSMNLKDCPLTKQSVLNLINAAQANITYTLKYSVYNKCASGGEWYSDVQAAIDAKALQGYTVTLISA